MNAYWFQEKGLWEKADSSKDRPWILLAKTGILYICFLLDHLSQIMELKAEELLWTLVELTKGNW